MVRVALYWAPPPRDPLWAAGCAWLGRDPETGATLPQPAVPDLLQRTMDARRYGFHATLKPPMRLATSYGAFVDAARKTVLGVAPFTLPPLHVADLGGFLALRETAPCPPLHSLADACVLGLEPHRAPAPEAELARRRRAGLTPAQEAMLVGYGYPHVLDTWFFHMTLTRRLAPAERSEVLPAAERHFDGLLGPRPVVEACVFTQAAADAPFLIAERLPLGG